jgi:menaquinone-dependent protoporphyrinogen oxidase
MTVLVTAASRHGATYEIAEAIGRALVERGVEAEVRKLEDVADLAGYEAVVLGSAVYFGNWLEPARRFVDEHAGELAERPTWLFSSGPTGVPPRPEGERAVQIDEVAAKTGALEHQLFAGRIERSELGFAERAVVRGVRAETGDFRDWDAIAAWAAGIAEAVRRRAERS